MKSFDDATILISNGRVCCVDSIIENGKIVIQDKKIVYVGNEKVTVNKNCKQIDAKGGFISPGFIDLHVNGGGGKDITAGTEEAFIGIARGHVKCGTTGILMAVTGPTEEIAKKCLKLSSKYQNEKTGGASVLGVHMEGPFINPKKQGPVFRGYSDVTSINKKVIQEFIEISNGSLKIITLAPELEGGLDLIEYIVSQGVIASIGHTEASYEVVLKAFKAGARYAAHIFNAMSPLHHRKPGTTGALLTSDENVKIELISDGHHVHPGCIEILIKTKGIENLVLVSDATEIVGTTLSSFTLPIGEGFKVEVRDGRTWGPDGQLIGSVLQMNHAIKNMNQWFDIPLYKIISCASIIPAKIIGLDKETGSLEEGKYADIAVMNSDFDVLNTIVRGDIVYSS